MDDDLFKEDDSEDITKVGKVDKDLFIKLTKRPINSILRVSMRKPGRR